MTHRRAMRPAGNSPLSRQVGFSLIELSVVVLIVGILLTMGISAMNAVRENNAFSTTITKQGLIKDALINYLRRNNRLPCPDTDTTAVDGVENRAVAGDPTTACSARFGILPYATLGLSRDLAQDGWGNLFSYHVSNTAGANTDWTLTANFDVGSTGTITVNDRNGVTVTPLATSVVAVVISHGRNGLGAYTIAGTRNTLPDAGTDELDNTNGITDAIYFKRTLTTDDTVTGGAFDDSVMVLTADDLLSPLYREGVLRPPNAVVQDEFQQIKLALIGYAMGNISSYGTSSCNTSSSTPKCRVLMAADISDGHVNAGLTTGVVPYLDLGISLAYITDPWGTRYRYTVDATSINTASGGGISSSSPASATTAFTLTTAGPDRTFGTADDIGVAYSVGEVRAYMVGLLP